MPCTSALHNELHVLPLPPHTAAASAPVAAPTQLMTTGYELTATTVVHAALSLLPVLSGLQALI
jgi:hypothetical protein